MSMRLIIFASYYKSSIMKTSIPLISLTVLSLTSCSFDYSHATLQGSYEDKAFIGYSKKPVPEVWDNLITFVTKEGLDVKVVDKNSGLLISERTSYLELSTAEWKGKPSAPEKYIVTSHVGGRPNKFIPSRLTAAWNARVKRLDNGETEITIRLGGIQAYYGVGQAERKLEAHSLRNFEKSLFEIIR